MGVPYEFNWYLVVSSERAINRINTVDDKFFTYKDGQRIYPIDAELPLIIKNKGCIGLVKILSFKVSNNSTNIEFELVQRMDPSDIIAQHYYNLYKSIKNDSLE